MAQRHNNSTNFTSTNAPHLPRTSYLLFHLCLVQFLLLLICAAPHVLGTNRNSHNTVASLEWWHTMRCYQTGNYYRFEVATTKSKKHSASTPPPPPPPSFQNKMSIIFKLNSFPDTHHNHWTDTTPSWNIPATQWGGEPADTTVCGRSGRVLENDRAALKSVSTTLVKNVAGFHLIHQHHF